MSQPSLEAELSRVQLQLNASTDAFNTYKIQQAILVQQKDVLIAQLQTLVAQLQTQVSTYQLAYNKLTATCNDLAGQELKGDN